MAVRKKVFFHELSQDNKGLLQEMQQAFRAQGKAVQDRLASLLGLGKQAKRGKKEGLQGKIPVSRKGKKAEQEALLHSRMHCVPRKALLCNTQKDEKG